MAMASPAIIYRSGRAACSTDGTGYEKPVDLREQAAKVERTLRVRSANPVPTPSAPDLKGTISLKPTIW